MRIGVVLVLMRVVVIVVMPVAVTVFVAMPVIVFFIRHDQPAGTGAEIFAKFAVGDVRAGGSGALALDVVVVAFLRQSDFGFEPQHLGAVFAH